MRALPRLLDSIPYSPKLAPEDLEKADPPRQDRTVPPSSPRRNERRPPDLNKPLPALTKGISEVDSESRSSGMVVDIGLRVSLHKSMEARSLVPVSKFSRDNVR